MNNGAQFASLNIMLVWNWKKTMVEFSNVAWQMVFYCDVVPNGKV
jgi:hypothetical protein